MKYAFVLGRVYSLSLAELFAVLAKSAEKVEILRASPEVLLAEAKNPINAGILQKTLGGTIKILKIVDFVKKRPQDSINFALQNYFKPGVLKKEFLAESRGKIQFGVSIYLLDMSLRAFGEPKRLGMFIKRAMQDSGSSIRLVLPEFNSLALASVVVSKNLLIEKGAEICVLAGSDCVYTAKTLSVQDFEDYGRRDYQRPVRDAQSGMIPPKVAQIMLNLSNAAAGQTILDPFCGAGTILQEGMLLGFKALGSDISPQAIAGSEKNLEWFRNRYKIPKGKYHLEISDAKAIGKVVARLAQIKALDKISAVVTEGCLGPTYSQYPKNGQIQANFKALVSLYKASFQEFGKFLGPGARVVFCLPAYKKKLEYLLFPSLDPITDLGYTLIDLIPKSVSGQLSFLKLTPRGTAVYDRKDQIVAREIVIFEKK